MYFKLEDTDEIHPPFPISVLSKSLSAMQFMLTCAFRLLVQYRRHGMTVAELATLFYHVHLESSQQATVTLEVLQMQGWEREMHFGDTGK